MSEIETDASSDGQRLLSHLAEHLFHEMGGALPVETLHLRATDHLDIDVEEVQQLTEDGVADGIYQIERGDDNAQRITGVEPVGSPPDVLEAIPGLDIDIETDDEPADFTQIDVVEESMATSLHDAGFDSYGALHAATPDDLLDVPTMTQSKAQIVIDQAGQHIPTEKMLASEALECYQNHLDEYDGQHAVVQDILEVSQDVGDPLALDPTVSSDETHYKGLLVLEDTGHPNQVRANEFPQHEQHCNDGEPIPPKATDIDHIGLDTLEATAQKLARGNMGLRLVGPHGSGKNYLLRYLHYKTNRVLVSVDADSSMLAQDMLGVSTVNENRVVVFRDGVLTKAMKHGYTIVINEGNVVPQGVMMALQKILNQNVLTVKESGEEIVPHPAARVVITMNPPTREYRDSEPFNAATRDRFQTIYFDYLDDDDEIALLDQMANANRLRVKRDDIGRMVEFADATRENDTWPTVSTRKLEHAIDWIDEGASVRGALKHVTKASAEPHQNPADTHGKLEDI
ncbi:AAA family ATPase [Halococcus thailandensis]|uniref:ATPase AAA n=1 Tax=Halococcus thailandensis JCM 13552 TaxID=1227457 RepID=M0NGJ2_9EURY|nr:AAA family ATPase [Halococcus thailandensis]EMA56224.1 ATPase AAA [Halococcus thailandensis JCM 13552]